MIARKKCMILLQLRNVTYWLRKLNLPSSSSSNSWSCSSDCGIPCAGSNLLSDLFIGEESAEMGFSEGLSITTFTLIWPLHEALISIKLSTCRYTPLFFHWLMNENVVSHWVIMFTVSERVVMFCMELRSCSGPQLRLLQWTHLWLIGGTHGNYLYQQHSLTIVSLDRGGIGLAR